jgi:hypothetical protein
MVIGSRGMTSGKFDRPRGLLHVPSDKIIYALDWSGRIQKFGEDGSFRAAWIMPEIKKGKPEDLCLTPDGRILVADTHYSRILIFSSTGDELGSFGSYGTGNGQFIYPVGVICDTNGFIYVSEYGENDRVQKFNPDGSWLKGWGTFGTGEGQFQRPSGLDIENNLLYVADAVNHRIQVFTLDGDLVKIIGSQGDLPGQFRYPYDVEVIGNTLYVLEYGSGQVQKLTLDGKPLATLGEPGRGDGQLASPWRMTSIYEKLLVADTGNDRVVRISF